MPSHAIATVSTPQFAAGTRALFGSAQRQHPTVPRYCIVQPEYLDFFERELGGLGTVIAADPPRSALASGPPRENTSKLLKTLVVRIPADVVLFVDSDAIFCKPAPEWWDVPPGLINAVRDRSLTVESIVAPEQLGRYRAQFPEVAASRGFNSGVFALRPADWPDLPARYERALEEGGYLPDPPITDQPILNALFFGKVRYLSRRFNVHCLFDDSIPRNARILHYTSRPKPWDSAYPRHEPQFYHWLKHGLGVTSRRELRNAALRIAARTPRRLLSRLLRKLAG